MPRDSSAHDAGLRAGDILLSVDGNHVSTIDDLKRALRSTRSRSRMKLGILRNNRPRSIILDGTLGGLTVEERER